MTQLKYTEFSRYWLSLDVKRILISSSFDECDFSAWKWQNLGRNRSFIYHYSVMIKAENENTRI